MAMLSTEADSWLPSISLESSSFSGLTAWKMFYNVMEDEILKTLTVEDFKKRVLKKCKIDKNYQKR